MFDLTVDTRDYLGYVSAFLMFAGFVPYIWEVFTNPLVKPSKATWLIWASLDTITMVGMYCKRTTTGQCVGAALGSWFVTLLAFKYGVAGWTRLDKRCTKGAAVALFLWWLFGNPTFGIVTSLGVVFFGSFPLFKYAWLNPASESQIAWTLWWNSSLYSIAAIPQYTLADAAQPWTFFAVQNIMMYIVHFRSRLKTV